MNAQKLKVDDQFDTKQLAESAPDQHQQPADIKPLGKGRVKFVVSPARQLQEQLEQQLGDAVSVDVSDKFSGLASISIIVGSATILWAMIAGLGYLLLG